MRRWIPLLTVALGTLMLLVDVTIVNVAIPDMSAELGSTLADLQWVVNGYALALGAVLLAVGGIADRWGHTRIYVGGLALFSIASLVCGSAGNAETLVAARVFQGLAGAAMLATSMALLTVTYSGKDRGIAFAVWGATAGAAGAIGPVLGGALTEAVSWRAVFLINVPVGIATICLALAVLPKDGPARGRRLDLPGTAMFTVAATAATFGLIEAGSLGWSSGRVEASLLIAAIAIVAFLMYEYRTKEPLLDISLLRNRTFGGILLGALLLNFAAFSYLLYTGIWLQTDKGMSPLMAGLCGAAPLALAGFVVSGAVGHRLHENASRWVISGGLALISIGAAAQSILAPDRSWVWLLPGLILAGAGVGLATPTLVSSAMAAVPAHRAGMAAGAVNSARQLGFVLGIALLGTILQTRTQNILADNGVTDSASAARAIVTGAGSHAIEAAPDTARASFAESAHLAFASGLNTIFLAAGIAGLAGAVLAALMIRDQPAQKTAGHSIETTLAKQVQ